MTWPTDHELRKAAIAAHDEAGQLLALLGIDAGRMLALYHPPKSTTVNKHARFPAAPQTLAELLALFDHTSFISESDQEEFDKCVAALVTQSTDGSLAM